jgi:hypothetical protein
MISRIDRRNNRRANTLLVLLTLADILVAVVDLSQGRIGSAAWALIFIIVAWFAPEGGYY